MAMISIKRNILEGTVNLGRDTLLSPMSKVLNFLLNLKDNAANLKKLSENRLLLRLNVSLKMLVTQEELTRILSHTHFKILNVL